MLRQGQNTRHTIKTAFHPLGPNAFSRPSADTGTDYYCLLYLLLFRAHSPRHQYCTHAALSATAPSPPQPWASEWLSRRTPEPSKTPPRTMIARFRQPRQIESASGGATLVARSAAPCRRPFPRCQGVCSSNAKGEGVKWVRAGSIRSTPCPVGHSIEAPKPKTMAALIKK